MEMEKCDVDTASAGSQDKHKIDVTSHTFKIPDKQIRTPADITVWEKSQAYSDIVGFILTLNEAIKNRKIRDDCHISTVVQGILSLLDQMEKWVEEIPPIDQPQRFGNKAFRTWFSRLKQEGPGLVQAMLPPQFGPAVTELSTYLIEGVGNDTRIDYGTGHELSFVAFLCCLCKVGALTEDDHPALVLRVFERYLNVMRRLQLTYRMEPAGSHGVWSLDDYQFLPFLWGSSQFVDHPRIKPKSFPNEDIYQSFYKDYLFLSAIKFINQVKTGPFAEHSNQLWGISGVATWTKVNSGLIKMYRVEVLAKYPIIQHMLFGSLLTLDPSPCPVTPVAAPAQTSAGIMAATVPSAAGMPYGTRMPPAVAVGGATRMPPPPLSGVATRMPLSLSSSGVAAKMPPSVIGGTGGPPIKPKIGGPPIESTPALSLGARMPPPPPRDPTKMPPPPPLTLGASRVPLATSDETKMPPSSTKGSTKKSSSPTSPTKKSSSPTSPTKKSPSPTSPTKKSPSPTSPTKKSPSPTRLPAQSLTPDATGKMPSFPNGGDVEMAPPLVVQGKGMVSTNATAPKSSQLPDSGVGLPPPSSPQRSDKDKETLQTQNTSSPTS